MRNHLSYTLLFLVSLIVPNSVYADTVLLLHGYLGSSVEWQRANITQKLDSAGWHDAGVLSIQDDRVVANKEKTNSTRRTFSVQLVSEKSIDVQTEQLHRYIDFVRHHYPEQQIILVGHSAGGVVARLYMVKNPSDDLPALITIASPHLGTQNAKYAQKISENILTWVETIPGAETLYRSQGLFFDLMPNRKDNLIAWLNVQEHPSARYYSIVRQETDDAIQDFVVPSRSQDMNEVFALRGRSETYKIKSMHGLTYKDGEIIKTILVDLYTI